VSISPSGRFSFLALSLCDVLPDLPHGFIVRDQLAAIGGCDAFANFFDKPRLIVDVVLQQLLDSATSCCR
jgi:hypothetical protein